MPHSEPALSKRIDLAINACGTADGPDLGWLKGILTEFRTKALSIESGEFLAASNPENDAEKKALKAEISNLQSKLKQADTKRRSDLEQVQRVYEGKEKVLNTQLQKVKAEIKRLQDADEPAYFQAEQCGDDEYPIADLELSPWQAKILKGIPLRRPETEDYLFQSLGFEDGESFDAHFHFLSVRGLIAEQVDAKGTHHWNRTTKGNEWLITNGGFD